MGGCGHLSVGLSLSLSAVAIWVREAQMGDPVAIVLNTAKALRTSILLPMTRAVGRAQFAHQGPAFRRKRRV